MNYELEVFYDGACPLCYREISHYMKKNKQNKIKFTDISLQSFDAKAHGLDPKEVQHVMHARLRDGTLITRVDAFLMIWKILNYNWAYKIGKTPGVYHGLNVFYSIFKTIRPYLPKRKCEEGNCGL